MEDSGATDDELGDNIVLEQEDNEIQDSGLVDKRKVIIFFINLKIKYQFLMPLGCFSFFFQVKIFCGGISYIQG